MNQMSEYFMAQILRKIKITGVSFPRVYISNQRCTLPLQFFFLVPIIPYTATAAVVYMYSLHAVIRKSDLVALKLSESQIFITFFKKLMIIVKIDTLLYLAKRHCSAVWN